MAATRLTDSQKQELVARFCGGASLQQLAALFGCSPTTVSRTAKAAIDLAEYELLLKQQKALRGGSAPGEAAPLGEVPLERGDDGAGASPGPAVPMGLGDDIGAAVVLTLTDPAGLPVLGTSVGSYALEEPSPSQGSSPEPAVGPVEVSAPEVPAPEVHAPVVPAPDVPAPEVLAAQQGALDFPGAQELAGESPALPSPGADALDDAIGATAVRQPILGRRRRSGAATPIPPPTTAFPATPAAAAAPGELAIDDADDFGADDVEDDLIDDDLSDDSGEEIFFAQGETFVAIPVGPIIDDLAIHEAVPFSAAALPSSAFLLVDKTVELQARPLRELPELGRLTEDELDRQALVVFVNPRQAKRQCGRTQRVIPLPDLSLLERTAPYLVAQGITRLVIEGALYALPGG